MKLYYAPGACSLSPHIVAREAGIPLKLVKVNFADHTTEDGEDYRAINPFGYVPAMALDNGSILREGPVLIQYLADQAPDARLLPAAGTLERLRVQEWLVFIGTELHKTFGPLFDSKAAENIKEAAREKLAKRFAAVDQMLAGHQYVTGDRFSVADAYLYTVVNWTSYFDIGLRPYPNVLAFMLRVAARPHVKEALAAEGIDPYVAAA